MTNFRGKTAIITGGGIGIGFEIARQLSSKGANIILNDINPEVALSAKEKLDKENGTCAIIVGDSSDISVIKKMIKTAEENFNGVDMTIANAGITTFGEFLTYSEDDFQKLTDVNLKGTFFLAQKSALSMIKNKKEGRILLMSSVTGHQAHKNLAAYGMSKAAIRALAKILSFELGPKNITVNAISPGATITERTLALDDHFEKQWEKITPTGKVTSTAEIAHTALFLLSPNAGQINGQTIIVDGGWTCTSPQPE
ncbi:SDR family NAD(P)-dependent oxidoreductase [Membranihabitans maritimus]|uniref:SDR family NAD(P)-dependent oxidoreductase n=1 Tax=Membranihabitans maritimus TaxID=2904244 RepID=UPI001F1CE375|nr:SDR family oxidoreductase [Membranihabitans maritimus]